MTHYPEGTGAGQPHPSSPPAGWYPDPNNAHLDRYWDGARWTLHTHVRPAAIVSPPPGQQATSQTGQGPQQAGQHVEPQHGQPARQPWQPAAQAPLAPQASQVPQTPSAPRNHASVDPWQAMQAAPNGAPEQPAHTPGSHVPTSDWNASQSADYQVRTAPTTPVLPQRGWLPDPSEIHLERMWDGDRWTARTRDRVTKVEHPSPGLYDYRPGEWVAQPQPRKRGVKAWGIVGLSVLFVLTVVVVFQGLDRLGESSLLADPGTTVDSRVPDDAWEAPLRDPDPIDIEPEDQLSNQTTPADIDYPVFGSTELVMQLEAGMIAQQEVIDVSSWARIHGFETVGEALLEAGTQNPYLFVSGWETMQQGDRVEVRPAYIYGDSEAERRRSETARAAAAGLANAGVHNSMSDEEKVTLIHDYIVDHAEYDVGAFDSIEDGETTPRVHQSQEAYGILVMGTAVCNGYAMAFSAMAEQAGLETITVTGSDSAAATGGSHAWNKVLVDDQWLLVDVTWNDPLGWDGGALRDYLLIEDNDPILSTRYIGDDWVVRENLGRYSS